MSTTAPPTADRMGHLKDAIEKHAKLQLLAERIPEQIAAARDAIEQAYRDLGITHPWETPRGNGRRAGAGETRAAVLAALPGTAAEVIQATGISSSSVHTTLSTLAKDGVVIAEGTRPGKTYHLADTAGARDGD